MKWVTLRRKSGWYSHLVHLGVCGESSLRSGKKRNKNRRPGWFYRTMQEMPNWEDNLV